MKKLKFTTPSLRVVTTQVIRPVAASPATYTGVINENLQDGENIDF